MLNDEVYSRFKLYTEGVSVSQMNNSTWELNDTHNERINNNCKILLESESTQ